MPGRCADRVGRTRPANCLSTVMSKYREVTWMGWSTGPRRFGMRRTAGDLNPGSLLSKGFPEKFTLISMAKSEMQLKKYLTRHWTIKPSPLTLTIAYFKNARLYSNSSICAACGLFAVRSAAAARRSPIRSRGLEPHPLLPVVSSYCIGNPLLM